ncbi:MAG TPA: hypothetical protein PK325_16730 [Cyclobacteriaceae bacterium]|nr:hypothetical protein [Cyclobacteriaceae bacterium]HMV09332.1 hypothetical protein [Cyclobacteriaceae bacterium]HMV91384.1 hypothetical protein [Cyclobacteriaceae bacterium]HMX01867.1 hypothetical protein [Cyclobacteriaceae bacterium]HMX50791.1 hypothetical protein [Cyclobacteriaceae bacterium]
MTRARFIFRIIYLISAIALVYTINQKTEKQSDSIVEFKFKMLKKIQQDSLTVKEKAESVVDETSAFMDGSTRIKRASNFLFLLLVLIVLTELFFAVRYRSKSASSDNPGT